MKRVAYYHIVIFLVVLTNSCSYDKKVNEDDQASTLEGKAELNIEEQNHPAESPANEPGCVFDQETQTDEFLIGVKEFSNYSWDDEAKIASIELENDERIDITRGGCDHFTYSVELISKTDTTPHDNADYWIARIQEYYSHLNDFDKELIDSLLEDRGEPETKTERFVFWPFQSEGYLGGIELIISSDKEARSIYIGYTQY